MRLRHATWFGAGVAAIYAAAMIVVAFTMASHLSHQVETALAAVSADYGAKVCNSDGDRGDASSAACCDSCTLAAAPGLGAAIANYVVYSFEISTRLNFAQRLGRVADAAPDDLRSRAPPLS